jgi:hypothetical protein
VTAVGEEEHGPRRRLLHQPVDIVVENQAPQVRLAGAERGQDKRLVEAVDLVAVLIGHLYTVSGEAEDDDVL